jgi:hypothetical protein
MSEKKHDQPISQPDPETTHTTDPQKHMEGPVSSMIQGIRENTKEEHNKKDHADSEEGRERSE